MATFNKFNTFVQDLGTGVHNLNTDTLKVYLTNAAPSAAGDSVKADLAEISAGFGYTSGGHDVTNVLAAGVMTGTDVTITATGVVGPFRYVVLYNDTPTSPADPLIGWWDYGSALTLGDGDTFTVNFDVAAILTIS